MSSSAAMLLNLLNGVDLASHGSVSSAHDSECDDMVLSSAENSPEISRRSSADSLETSDAQEYTKSLCLKRAMQFSLAGATLFSRARHEDVPKNQPLAFSVAFGRSYND